MDRRSWTQQEDQAIVTLVDEFGVMDWTNISQKLKQRYNINQRTGKQCRERWYNHLNPQVNKKPWTDQQQKLLFQIHRKSGNKWKLMSKYFEGRTDNDIKNHFYSTLRRSLRRLNKFIGQKNSTTQMREIKPSVLSTIMNYIYQQQNNIQTNIVNSLKDLPYLVFEFSNYKPVKGKAKTEEDEMIKEKINFIFLLINKANVTYQTLKQSSKSAKGKRGRGSNGAGMGETEVGGENDYGRQHCQQHENYYKSSTQQMLTTNNSNNNNNKNKSSSTVQQCKNSTTSNNNSNIHPKNVHNAASIELAQQLDFIKYLPKKSYSSTTMNNTPPRELSALNNKIVKSKEKAQKILRNSITYSQIKIQQQEFDDDDCNNSKENKCYSGRQQQQFNQYNQQYSIEKLNSSNKYSIVQRLEREMNTELMMSQQFNNNNTMLLLSNSFNYNNYNYNHNSMVNCSNGNVNNGGSNIKKEGSLNNNNIEMMAGSLEELGYLRQRRISLQAYQDYIQDEDIGEVQQPSEASGFYCGGTNSFQDLVVVGKQLTIHQMVNPIQAKLQQPHQDNSNIDQLIEMNYSQ